MSQAKALLDAGQLGAAIEELTREVKANPTDTSRRIFLFELLCLAGDLDRAEKQLDVVGSADAQAAAGVLVYRQNIKAERDRRRLFSDGLQPHFLAEPPAYVDLHLEAINRLREGNYAEARAALDRAEEQRPALKGALKGQPFEDFRDCDDFVGPVLELIVKGQYSWLPFEQIRRMEISAPKQLRDLIWTTASIESIDGTVGEVFLPALYAGSAEHANDQVRLGRMTDWTEIGGDLYRAAGLRLFLVDDDARSIFEAGTVEFDHAGAQVPEATPSQDVVH
jgi:type VI secretion system protein ImpE